MKRSFSHQVTLAAMFAMGSFHFNTPKPGEGEGAPGNAPPAATPDTLRQEFGRLNTEAEQLVNSAIAANRELTDAEKAANGTRFTRMQAIQGLLNEQARFASLTLAALPAAPSGGRVQLPNEPGRDEFMRSEGRGTPLDRPSPGDRFGVTDTVREQYREELRHFAAEGEIGPIAKRFATITTATNSGVLLPKAIAAPIVPTSVNPFRAAFDFYNMLPIQTTTTADWEEGVMDATAGGIVAENASAETENGGISAKINLKPKTFESGSTWYSNLVLRANDFDLLTGTIPQLRYNKELGLQSAIAAALIADAGITQSVASASISTLSYDNLVDLDMALPSRFDALKIMLLSKAAFTAARKLKGDDGHPVLINDPQRQGLAFFNNQPVFRCDYLESFGASKVIGLTISLLGFKLRDVTTEELARYANDKARKNQTGLCLFAYHGYGWTPDAVAKLTCPEE
jgi:HK97 family phage major capsid protein